MIGGVPASNLAGSSARGEPVEADVGDHVAAAEERRHGVEQRLAAPQHADARRAAHLVAAEGDEVGAHACTSVTLCGTYWQASTMASAPAAWAASHELAHRGDRAEHVAHRREGERLGAVEQRGEVGEVELAVGGERHPAQLDAPLGGEHVPRHDVGVVLHLGQHDDVAVAAGWPGPRL